MDIAKINEIIQKTENQSKGIEINDQDKYLEDQKIDTLKSLN